MPKIGSMLNKARRGGIATHIFFSSFFWLCPCWYFCGREAIVHLSGLMRYVIKDAHDYKIPLRKEIDYIGNYIELQKARLGNTTYVRFDCSGDPASKEIAPLILITYIECV